METQIQKGLLVCNTQNREELRQQLPRTISNTQRTGRNTQTVHNESTDKSVQVLQNHSITHSYQDQRQKNKEKTIGGDKRCYEHKNPSKPKGFMENEPRNEKEKFLEEENGKIEGSMG